MDFEIGQRVIVKPVWDGWLSKPKYPNRTGTIIQKNSVDEQLLFVDLDETARCKRKTDTFWSCYLEPLHEQTLILPTTQEST